MKSIIPTEKNPFYIVTPPYTKVSAGVTTLHLLCHYLNLAGESAYIINYPAAQLAMRSLPAYATLSAQLEYPGGMIVPQLTQNIIDHYHEKKLTPVVIYPEVFDNPLHASFFGRYILNYPGKLNTRYEQPADFSISYAKTLADFCNAEFPTHNKIEDILFVPTVDLDFWHNPKADNRRSGSCFYAGKLRGIHNDTPENVPADSIEILRSDQMSREQVRDLFWNTEVFYCYEDTALAIEALLCGCPTIFVKNKYFAGPPLGANETGKFGWSMSDDVDGLEKARHSINQFPEHIAAHLENIPSRIANLGQKWRTQVQKLPYLGTIQLPLEPRIILFDQPIAPHRQLSVADEFDNSQKVQNRIAFHFAKVLIIDTIKQNGIGGLARRILLALRNHGAVGIIRILSGKPPKGDGQ